MFGIWREKIGRPSMEGNGRTMATKQGASEGDEWWVWGIGPRGATGYRVGVQRQAIRAGIMGGCKPAESHVEEREVRKKKRTGGSLAAGCCGRVRLCLWPRMPLAAHSQPAAGAEQSSQLTARAGLLPMLWGEVTFTFPGAHAPWWGKNFLLVD